MAWHGPLNRLCCRTTLVRMAHHTLGEHVCSILYIRLQHALALANIRTESMMTVIIEIHNIPTNTELPHVLVEVQSSCDST